MPARGCMQVLCSLPPAQAGARGEGRRPSQADGIVVCTAGRCAALLLPSYHTSLQGKQVLKDGIGRAPEEEEPVDPALARQFLQVRSAGSGCRRVLKQFLQFRSLFYQFVFCGAGAGPPVPPGGALFTFPARDCALLALAGAGTGLAEQEGTAGGQGAGRGMAQAPPVRLQFDSVCSRMFFTAGPCQAAQPGHPAAGKPEEVRTLLLHFADGVPMHSRGPPIWDAQWPGCTLLLRLAAGVPVHSTCELRGGLDARCQGGCSPLTAPLSKGAELVGPGLPLHLPTPPTHHLPPAACSSLGVSQLVCLGGFNNTRQEFEVGGCSVLWTRVLAVCQRTAAASECPFVSQCQCAWQACCPLVTP